MNPASVTTSMSESFADFALSVHLPDLPDEVVAKAKTHILDTIGCGLAGSTVEWARPILDLAETLGGPPESTIIGRTARVAAPNAALAWGAACSALDFDDTGYWTGAVHCSRALIPAVVAVSEAFGRSGADLVRAAVVGWEVAMRVGNAQGVDRERRYDRADRAHYYDSVQKGGTGARNHFGVAAATALLMGLRREQIVSAMGLVAVFEQRIPQSHREGAEAYPLNAGWEAHAGVMAALAAGRGVVGPRLIFEGDRGYFKRQGLGDRYDPAKMTAGLGEEWLTLGNCLKFYPAGHGTHHWIESLKQLIGERGLAAGDVAEIVCYVPQHRMENHFEFREQKLAPRPYNARFSLPFLLAVTLIDGDYSVRSTTWQKVRDPAVLDLAGRVRPQFDEDAWAPENRGKLTVRTRDGQEWTVAHPHLLGLPDNPPSEAQVAAKFRDNASFAVSRGRAEWLLERLTRLDEVADVRDVLRASWQ